MLIFLKNELLKWQGGVRGPCTLDQPWAPQHGDPALVGLKSKVKPPTPSPSLNTQQGPHIITLGPWGAPSNPPNNNTHPQNDPFWLTL